MQYLFIKKYNFFILLFLIITGLFVFNISVFASSSRVLINKQPSSTGSVDSPFSQQPIIFVKDSNNNPLSGVTVTAIATGGGNLSGDLAEITDSNGLATFTNLSYSGADSFQIIFGSSAGKATSNSIKLSPGAASASNSSISASPLEVIADGQSFATIKIICEDQYGNLIPDAQVTVTTSGSDNSLNQPNSTDDPGITTVNLTSTKAESKIISVSVNGISIGNSDPINFTPGKIAKLLISADSPINTNQTSQITVTGEDQFNNIATNDNSTQVILSVDNGGSLSSALVTMTNGVASASLNKKISGTVNLTASIGNINAQQQITFTSADDTAPNIISQYPLSGQKDVPVDVVPYIDFSKTMDITTLTTDNIELKKLTDNSDVAVEVLVANGGKRVILQPSSHLDLNTNYYLYATTNVSDSSGNNLSSVYTSNSFTTALDSQSSSISQEQNIIQDIKDNNVSTAPSSNNQENLQNSDNNANNSANISDTSNESPSTSSNNNSLTTSPPSGNTITIKTGSLNTNSNLLNSAPAGLLNAFKNFDISKFGNWYVENFLWIISLIIICVIIYIFWIIYQNKK